jgi:hypothetical protein
VDLGTGEEMEAADEAAHGGSQGVNEEGHKGPRD